MNKRILIAIGVVVIAVLATSVWLWATAGRETTDDAQVDSHVTPMAARVGGAGLGPAVADWANTLGILRAAAAAAPEITKSLRFMCKAPKKNRSETFLSMRAAKPSIHTIYSGAARCAICRKRIDRLRKA